ELPAALQDLIQVPVRPCVIEGSTQAEGHRAGEMVSGINLLSLLLRADDQIWLPQAHISFRSVAAIGMPVIQDPRYPDPANPSSQMGDIDVEGLQGPRWTPEAEQAAMVCEQAWANLSPQAVGIILVNLRRYLHGGDTLGLTSPVDKGLLVQQAG